MHPEIVRGSTSSFSWEQVAQELGVGLDGSLNIADLAVDRHARSAMADKAAFRFLTDDGGERVVSYRELAGLTNRFAHLLRSLKVERGDTLFVLCERIPELYIAVLGALKLGVVVSPLFVSFGPAPIRDRIAQARGKVLVTTSSLYQRKVAALRGELPTLLHVLLVDDLDIGGVPGTHDLTTPLAQASDAPISEPTRADDLALLHFTSGTTGLPKGAMHVHGAVLGHDASARTALDLRPDDVFWCTADPGWVTGTSYGIIAPLVIGATCIVDQGDFDPLRWMDILVQQRVNVWYTAPTAIRMLMKAGNVLFADRQFPDLRFVASVGEPLNPEAVRWGQEALGQPVHDNWWQTETGCIMVANAGGQQIKPGSMGRPLPGVAAHVVRRLPDHRVERIETPEAEGELALETPWPSMFRGYLGQPARYAECFADGLYLSGDLVRRDADGYYWFVGRRDDVIKSAGHLVGPCEIENALLSHPAVAEAGVIGKPDALAGESIKASVVLKSEVQPDEDLRLALMAHARQRLGAAIAPKEIAFVPALPHTRSGKIMRRLLRARELGLPEGDRSALESGSE